MLFPGLILTLIKEPSSIATTDTTNHSLQSATTTIHAFLQILVSTQQYIPYGVSSGSTQGSYSGYGCSGLKRIIYSNTLNCLSLLTPFAIPYRECQIFHHMCSSQFLMLLKRSQPTQSLLLLILYFKTA